MTIKAQVGIAAAIQAKTGIARDLENLPETMKELVEASKDALARTQAIKPDDQHAKILDEYGRREGTPETLFKASRAREGNIAALFMSGKIDQEQLGWAEEIYRAYEIIASDVTIRNVSYEPRIDNQASARDVLVEGIGRVRREVAYTYWRNNIPQPYAMIMEMLTGERISYSSAALKYKMHKRKSLALLLKAIDLWPDALSHSEKNVDAADVAAAHAGLV